MRQGSLAPDPLFEREHRARALEDAGERRVVPLGEGIELVVMAARAGEGDPYQGARGDIDLLIDDVRLNLALVRVRQQLWPEHQEAGCDDPPVVLLRIGRRREQV